jgi:DNA-binding response OmpR family regulator
MLNRILVLDDNQDVLDIVEETLSYENFQVLVTSDSHNIIEIAKIFRPDLFILDYKVSGPKSGEICRQIKWHPQFGQVPVILSSAYFHKDINFENLGCDDVIAKPFGLDELVGKVNNLVTARA